ncbi:hypothetical protein DL93DRAFT_2071021 [Clavulina sp. PMI_390]|nr:hypothetical protein DL93DRAFT_2071021 [Clavulina sp. PMI_390]
MYNRYFGGCNVQKQDLILCLRKERVERTAKHVKETREAKKGAKDAWRRHTESEPRSELA